MTVTNSAMAYKQNNFGQAISIDMTDNQEEFAQIFSEGSETLKKLLLYLWGKNIATIACCTGHICKPLFKKRFLWTEVYVSEKEYLENQHKKGYRYVLTDTTGYLAFKYSYENMYHAAHTLREMVNYRPLKTNVFEVAASYQPYGFQSVPLSRPRSSCGPKVFIS